MKNRVSIILVGLIIIIGPLQLTAQKYPTLSQYYLVNDFANVLTDKEEAQLNEKLKVYNDSTSTQIAVVVLESLQKYTGDSDYPIDKYAVELAQKEGIGQKEKRNGILFLVAIAERQMRIEVGYGLEPVITDGIAKRIIEYTIKPRFKEGDYYLGIDEGTDKMIQYATGEFIAGEENKKDKDPPILLMVLGVLLFIIALSFLLRRFSSENYSGTGTTKPTPWFWGSSGGGSWGGGGSGGGGFGGFGGGSFGGGGASGSW